jgi:hypothetical protein
VPKWYRKTWHPHCNSEFFRKKMIPYQHWCALALLTRVV